MTLNTRPLGTSELEITTVGFGAWAIGGGGWSHGWGPQEDAASIAAIRRAVERGVNWVDTAAIYGLGHSEEVVGKALREIPDAERPYVFTKGGLVPDRTRPYDEPLHTLKPESIRLEVEASLRRLRVDRIDLYQFHWPDQTGTPVEESWAEMARVRMAVFQSAPPDGNAISLKTRSTTPSMMSSLLNTWLYRDIASTPSS